MLFGVSDTITINLIYYYVIIISTLCAIYNNKTTRVKILIIISQVLCRSVVTLYNKQKI